MNKNRQVLIFLFTLSALFIFQAAPSLADLVVEFTDPAWDGKTIPEGQHCKKFGGNGATPPLIVSNIPAEANAIILQINNKTYKPLTKNGGHGKIGFDIDPGMDSVTLPPVPGGTDDMPEGVWLVKKNRATGAWKSKGYLPPCSGGRGHGYEAIVHVVVKKDKNKFDEISSVKIVLGWY